MEKRAEALHLSCIPSRCEISGVRNIGKYRTKIHDWELTEKQFNILERTEKASLVINYQKVTIKSIALLCENDYTTQSNLQIQCNPYQITNDIFHRTRTKMFTICMETQKTPNSQSNLEKEKWSWRNLAPWLQTILQSYINQDNVVLALKQKYKSMEQDRKPRDKPMHIWAPYLWQRRQEYTIEKRQHLQ